MASPGAFATSLLFWNLSHLLDALGDRNSVLNELLHFLPWIWLLLLNPLIYKKVFLLLSFALENKMFCFDKRWCFKVGGMFSKIKLDGGSIMAMMVQHWKRCTSTRYQTLGEMIKLRSGGWLAREESLGVVSPSKSIKDRLDVGLMIEDLLTGRMPHHG